MVAHEHCSDWNGQGLSIFYTQHPTQFLNPTVWMCEDREDALSRNQPSVFAERQPSLEFCRHLTLRHFLHKTDPSSTPQRGPRTRSRLYNIYNMEIAFLFLLFWQRLLTICKNHLGKKLIGYLTKYEDNLRSIISNFTVWFWQGARPVNGNK